MVDAVKVLVIGGSGMVERKLAERQPEMANWAGRTSPASSSKMSYRVRRHRDPRWWSRYSPAI
jgi:hypothetical protein